MPSSGAGHPLVRPGCLTRGVTLYYALRRAGDDVSLCFGVGEDGGQTAGHCWLDKAGRPLLERVDPRTEIHRGGPADAGRCDQLRPDPKPVGR